MRRPIRPLVARLGVGVLAAAVVVVAAQGALGENRSGARDVRHGVPADQRRLAEDYVDLRGQLAATVPPGTRIVSGDMPPGFPAGWQRRGEFAIFDDVILASNPAEARWRVSIVAGTAPRARPRFHIVLETATG